MISSGSLSMPWSFLYSATFSKRVLYGSLFPVQEDSGSIWQKKGAMEIKVRSGVSDGKPHLRPWILPGTDGRVFFRAERI